MNGQTILQRYGGSMPTAWMDGAARRAYRQETRKSLDTLAQNHLSNYSQYAVHDLEPQHLGLDSWFLPAAYPGSPFECVPRYTVPNNIIIALYGVMPALKLVTDRPDPDLYDDEDLAGEYGPDRFAVELEHLMVLSNNGVASRVDTGAFYAQWSALRQLSGAQLMELCKGEPPIPSILFATPVYVLPGQVLSCSTKAAAAIAPNTTRLVWLGEIVAPIGMWVV